MLYLNMYVVVALQASIIIWFNYNNSQFISPLFFSLFFFSLTICHKENVRLISEYVGIVIHLCKYLKCSKRFSLFLSRSFICISSFKINLKTIITFKRLYRICNSSCWEYWSSNLCIVAIFFFDQFIHPQIRTVSILHCKYQIFFSTTVIKILQKFKQIYSKLIINKLRINILILKPCFSLRIIEVIYYL